MTCHHCTESQARAWHGFEASCRGCIARKAARSPEYAEARRLGTRTRKYRTLLDRLGVTHEEARAAARLDVVAAKSVMGML